jgi:hypothetical protein
MAGKMRGSPRKEQAEALEPRQEGYNKVTESGNG